MRKTIYILGTNNFWFSTTEVEYETEEELQLKINAELSEVKQGIKDKQFDTNTEGVELHIVVGEMKFRNIPT